jgi:hypothetical protein
MRDVDIGRNVVRQIEIKVEEGKQREKKSAMTVRRKLKHAERSAVCAASRQAPCRSKALGIEQ